MDLPLDGGVCLIDATMKTVFKHISKRAKTLADNVLFTWLADPSVPPKEKLLFSPMAIDFIMGFRDFNKYYVRYENPRNELEEALNVHASEDETHSELLLRDWEQLGLDARLGWRARDLLWWMTCDETRESRALDFELIEMAYRNPDPLIRFAIIESMEAAGNVFFRRTVPIIDALGPGSHDIYPYYGRYHLDRETGHLQAGANEKLFFQAELSEDRRAHAIRLVDRVFEIFERHFEIWNGFARDAYENGFSYDPAAAGRASATMRDEPAVDVSRYLQLSYPPSPTGTAADLARACREAVNQLWETPAYTWMRTAFPGDFRRMTRYFLLQWVVDNWACADYFTFDTPYAEPKTPLERGINRLSQLYASEMKRRYVEWETLQFDEYTGFSVRDALRHYWLDERVELHRKVFADLRKLTFDYPKALHRYWILKCFVRFGDTMMHSLGVAMKHGQEADEAFITFAGHPERLHPDLPPDEEADAAVAAVELEQPSEEDAAIIRRIIAATQAQEAERSEITWRIVQEKRYEHFDRKWQARAANANASASAVTAAE